MTTINSTVNTYFGNQTIGPDSSFTGSYDDTSGFTTTKIVCSAAQAGILKLNYADSSAGANNFEELYAIYADHPSALTSLVKKRYAKVVLENTDIDTSMTSVNLKTKFSERTPHPYLSYITDDVTANVTVDISDLTFAQAAVQEYLWGSSSTYDNVVSSGASSSSISRGGGTLVTLLFKTTSMDALSWTPQWSPDNSNWYDDSSAISISTTVTSPRTYVTTLTNNASPYLRLHKNSSTSDISLSVCAISR